MKTKEYYNKSITAQINELRESCSNLAVIEYLIELLAIEKAHNDKLKHILKD